MCVSTDVSVRVVSACPFVCSFLFRLSERETEPKRKDPAGHSHPYPSTVETGLRNSLRSNSPRLIPSLVAAVLNGLFIKWRKKTLPRPLHKGGELSSLFSCHPDRAIAMRDLIIAYMEKILPPFGRQNDKKKGGRQNDRLCTQSFYF